MLKKCFLSPKYDSSASKVCGEVVFQSETSFAVICKFCDIKIFEFNEFIQHFRNTHWTEISVAEDILKQLDVKIEETPLGKQSENEYMKAEDCDEEQILYEEYAFTDTDDIDNQDEWIPEKDGDQGEINDDDSSDVETIAILKKKLKTTSKEKATFKCCLCQHTFTNKSYYENHLRRHKSDQFKCDKCNKSFARENQLAHHLVIHNGYCCKICTKVFKSYDSLRYHKETHIQTKNFVCDFEGCNKAFATKGRVRVHKRVHFPEVFVCEVCGSRQRNKQALKDHIRKHTGEKPFACNICDRRFTTKSLLNEHKACHETERRHVCDVCGKSFNRPKALYHHKPLHLDIKKFVCKLCGSAYAQAAGLSAHMRKHKEDKTTNQKANSTLNIFNIIFPEANYTK